MKVSDFCFIMEIAEKYSLDFRDFGKSRYFSKQEQGERIKKAALDILTGKVGLLVQELAKIRRAIRIINEMDVVKAEDL